MTFRPTGVPVTGVPGIPMVGYNQTIVGQPVTMVPMMQPTMIGVPVRNMQQVVQVRVRPGALGPQIIGQAIQQSDGPPVTVFVGNISEKATDTLVRQILMKCGTVNNWKRVQGASGKLQAFGFCEFKEPDSALRALRLLQGYQLANKSLLIKVDDNAQTIIEQWKKRVGVMQDSDGMDVLAPQVKNRDEAVRNDLKLLLREYATDLVVDEEEEVEEKPQKSEKDEKQKSESKSDKSRSKSDSKSDSKKGEEISKEDYGEKKELIVDQIHQFRESQKRQEEEKSRKPEERSSRDRREPEKRDDRERDRTRRSPSHERRSRRERSKERSKERTRRDNRSRSRDRTRERSRERRRRSEERRKDEDELIERRRLERKIKEKDSAYQERLIGWEARERRKMREWERIESRDSEIRRQMYKEAKRLRDFLENYDDERDDRKFYFGSGSAFQRRLENRDKEKESDMRDRRKEEEEIGGLRKKLANEGHPDPDGAIAKVIKEAEEVWKPFITPEVRKRKHSSRSSSSSDSDSSSESAPDSDDEPIDVHVRKKSSDNHRNKNQNVENRHHSSDEDDNDVDMDIAQPDHDDRHHDNQRDQRAPIRLPGLSSTTIARNSPAANSPAFQSTFIQKGASRKVASVFQDEEDDNNHETAKKRKVPIQKEIKNAEEKRKAVKALIDRIPTDRGPLFAYPMVWENLTSDLMTNRITPWVQKKLKEIIGEDEPTLVQFIAEKLEAESKPENILSEIRVVLDDEADMFVIKLWRLLIYETEARREGIM